MAAYVAQRLRQRQRQRMRSTGRGDAEEMPDHCRHSCPAYDSSAIFAILTKHSPSPSTSVGFKALSGTGFHNIHINKRCFGLETDEIIAFVSCVSLYGHWMLLLMHVAAAGCVAPQKVSRVTRYLILKFAYRAKSGRPMMQNRSRLWDNGWNCIART